ncbi:hypothetical protein SMD11_4566 [Streptomyces albireticuli]|uniref:Secreted protein n=1 Tax=Streptomyces albireticuli TaxID=1940 RepID=A0A1Z2L798_9ACTN|nr:hypothetical protein [Streptomyces albireticuli]ARZ70163.1 hypothetical protein SMD11_4566 [Streptomyces albireticuli]
MEAVAVIVALIFAVLVALGVIATVKTVRAVKRGVDRTVTQARRTVEDTRLKARQYVQPGAAGEVAQLRLSLRTSMRATQEALRLAAPEDASLSEALQLFERLSAHGHELDEELRRLEAEPDRERIAACLPELRERTERVRESADSLRWAAQDRARRFAEDDLEALSGQIRMEAGALRHWTVEEPEGTAPAAGRPESASSGPAAGPAADRGADRAARPETGPAAEQAAGERPAITGGAEAWQPGYSWQKARRPESTT